MTGVGHAPFWDDAPAFKDAARNSRYALAAASMALRQAAFRPRDMARPYRAGMYLGSGEGPHDFTDYAAMQMAGWNGETRTIDSAVWGRTVAKRMHPRHEHEQEPNMALSHLAHAFGFRGPAYNCMTACAASTQANGTSCRTWRP